MTQKNCHDVQAPDGDDGEVVVRPDGFYWENRLSGVRAGPFTTREAAIADLEYNVDITLEACESLEEAEAELGIADWIDPETGLPAENSVPRIEDH